MGQQQDFNLPCNLTLGSSISIPSDIHLPQSSVWFSTVEVDQQAEGPATSTVQNSETKKKSKGGVIDIFQFSFLLFLGFMLRRKELN
jgi:hypothetical protein